MTYLLDADIVNYLIKGVPAVRKRFREAVAKGAEFVLSPVVHYQVTRHLKLKGAARLLNEYVSMVSNWLPASLEAQDWEEATDLWVERHRIGRPIQDADLLIAISARKVRAVLVTNNTRHFEGLGVVLENWASVEAA